MKRVFSAGGIVFNNQGQVLLTQNSANHYWGFPKGTVDADDASRAAWKAVRLSMAVRLTTETADPWNTRLRKV